MDKTENMEKPKYKSFTFEINRIIDKDSDLEEYIEQTIDIMGGKEVPSCCEKFGNFRTYHFPVQTGSLRTRITPSQYEGDKRELKIEVSFHQFKYDAFYNKLTMAISEAVKYH